jgi:hypothetical protein
LTAVFCRRESDRSAATWRESLAPFRRLEFVVSDGAKGIAAAVRELAASLACEGRRLVHGLDVFHTLRDAGRILAAVWRRAEEAFASGEQADAAVAQAKRRGVDARKAAGEARGVWTQAQQELAEVERLQHGYERAKAALGIFRPDGQLNNRAWAEAEVAAATAELAGPDWKKVRNRLRDERALAFLDRMHERLEEAEPDPTMREAMVWRWRLRHRRQYDAPPGSLVALVEAVARNRPLNGEEADSYRRVAAVLETTVRASSCVEGMNSVLRMQQGRHRKMTPGMLDLKRLYWNTRPFRTGRRRRNSPYQLLGLPLSTHDFWQLLNGNPAELAQQLSKLKRRE